MTKSDIILLLLTTVFGLSKLSASGVLKMLLNSFIELLLEMRRPSSPWFEAFMNLYEFITETDFYSILFFSKFENWSARFIATLDSRLLAESSTDSMESWRTTSELSSPQFNALATTFGAGEAGPVLEFKHNFRAFLLDLLYLCRFSTRLCVIPGKCS